MIYTVTLNPSVDYYILVENIEVGAINRFDEYRYIAAGKGINCSKILDLYGIDSKAVYFSGNYTGEYIDSHLKKYEHIHTCPIINDQSTRINIKVLGSNETAFNSGGPVISEKAKEELLSCLDGLKAEDYIIISGSLPKNVDNEYVKTICRQVAGTGARIILDVPNFKLDDFKGLDIYLIKPNIDEIRYILDNEQVSKSNCTEYMNVLHECGIKNILLSLGGQGAYFSGEAGRFTVNVPQVDVVSTVGAGDSMLAAFVGLIAEGKKEMEALVYSGATGTAMVMTEDLPTMDLIEEIISRTELIIEN